MRFQINASAAAGADSDVIIRIIGAVGTQRAKVVDLTVHITVDVFPHRLQRHIADDFRILKIEKASGTEEAIRIIYPLYGLFRQRPADEGIALLGRIGGLRRRMCIFESLWRDAPNFRKGHSRRDFLPYGGNDGGAGDLTAHRNCGAAGARVDSHSCRGTGCNFVILPAHKGIAVSCGIRNADARGIAGHKIEIDG